MAALLQTRGRGWIQESYETGDPDIKRRAKQLRALGYRVVSSSMGSQVTQYGRVKMTLLDIRPGTTGDAYLEQVNPRRHSSVRDTKKYMKKLLMKYHPKLSKEQQRREMAEVRRIIRAGGTKSYGGRMNRGRRNQDWRGSIEARVKSAYGFGYAEGEASARHDEAARRFHHDAWRKWLSAYGNTAALKRQLEDSHRAGYSEGASYGNPALAAPGRGDRVLNLRGFTGAVVARRNGRIDFLKRGRR